MARKVICVWCKSKFKEILPIAHDESEPTQGEGCAAYAWLRDGIWSLQAAYGSKYKGELYTFIQNLPTKEADPVCDDCIAERLEDFRFSHIIYFPISNPLDVLLILCVMI